jgi:hypothetical protein
MRRRRFIALLGTLMALLPFAVTAEPQQRVRRIGVLMTVPEAKHESSHKASSMLFNRDCKSWDGYQAATLRSMSGGHPPTVFGCTRRNSSVSLLTF